jgi:hypothetical protein
MFRRVMMVLALPVSGLMAQSTPVHITIVGTNNAEFQVVRSTDTGKPNLRGRGRWEIADSGAVGSTAIAIIATDSLSRVHVEASQDGRLVASADGGFVVVRRDPAFVSIEARGRAPSSFTAADLRKP